MFCHLNAALFPTIIEYLEMNMPAERRRYSSYVHFCFSIYREWLLYLDSIGIFFTLFCYSLTKFLFSYLNYYDLEEALVWI